MSEPEKIFNTIIKNIPNGSEGKMFGAKSIKSKNGKTAAFFWNKNMTFKLNAKDQLEALKINGAKIGSHLYAKEKLMKGWILIPEKHSDKWMEFAEKSVDYAEKLDK